MKLLRFSFNNIFALGKGEVLLDSRGLVLVTGHNEDDGGANGAGKSSLANKGIIWTLYGQTTGGLKADTVINRHGKKSGWGQITYIGNDNKEYTIRRERPAKLQLFQEENDLSTKKAIETQKLIDQSLGRDFATFSQTEVFGQGRLLGYASLQPSEQKKVLEQILPIETLDQWSEEAREQAKVIKEQLDKVKQASAVEESKFKTLQSQATSLKNEQLLWSQDHQQKIQALQKALQAEEFRIHGDVAKVKEYTDLINALTIPTQDELDVLTEQDKYASIDCDAAKISCEKALIAEQQWQDAVWKHKIELGHLPKDEKICPTCNRELDPDVYTKLQEDRQKIEILCVEADFNWAQSRQVTEQYTENHSTIAVARDKVVNIRIALVNMVERARQLEDLRTAHQNKIQSQVPQLQARLDELNLLTNPYIESLDKLSIQVKTQGQLWTDVTKNVTLLEQEHKDLTYWQMAYGKDIKLKLFSATCPYLDHATTNHLRQLDNAQLHVQFSTVKLLASGEGKDDFNVRCWSDHGGEGFDSLSGGEQQMVSFAIGRALADVARMQIIGESQFQILDEPFSMLDARNSEAIVNYLHKDKEEGTVLLISNEDHLKGLINERIHVVKKNGIAEVEKGII